MGRRISRLNLHHRTEPCQISCTFGLGTLDKRPGHVRLLSEADVPVHHLDLSAVGPKISRAHVL